MNRYENLNVHFIAQILQLLCAKNCSNRMMFVEVIARHACDIFLGHSVVKEAEVVWEHMKDKI